LARNFDVPIELSIENACGMKSEHGIEGMDTEQKRRWRDADAALDRLLDLPRGERDDELALLPPDVRALAVQLLAAHDRQGPLDQEIAGMLPGSPFAEAQLDLRSVPQHIGPWALAEVVGRGGMSIVYRAARTLAAGQQTAALKLLTVAALAADGRRRFLREHEVLARLTHPHIATLLDAGVLEDGTPYLAMQLVEGERIDDWCHDRHLDARAIVRLFLQVCDAVAYAHRQLVVHRDLKPGNILVDAHAQVRLLDFGIARLLDDAIEAEATRTEFRALTPQYAAPEQFSGTDTGTSADVFGLGAVLYHLLTGRPPRLPRQGHDTRITQPSRAAASAEALSEEQRLQSARTLRGDLDAILLMALDTDPARRYPDAAGLAEDLRRWLEQRPVRAARGDRIYRIAKFTRRNRGGVAASLLVSAAILAGVLGTLWQAARAERAAAAAQHEAQRAREVKDFLVLLFDASDLESGQGGARDAREMLAQGAERARQDGGLQPSTRVELLTTIASAQRSYAQHDEAGATLDVALALAEADPDVPARLRAEARLQLANLHFAQSAFAAARDAAAEVLAEIDALDDAQAMDLHARALVRRGSANVYLEQFEAARSDLGAARALLDRRADPALDRHAELAGAMASLEYSVGRHNESFEHMKRELALWRAQKEKGPRITRTLTNLSAGAAMVGRLDEALQYDEESLLLARELYPADHPRIGMSLYGIGDSQRMLGRYAESVANLEQAIAILAAAGNEREAHMAEMALGRTLLAKGDHALVPPLVERIRAGIDERYGASSTATMRLSSMAGEALMHLREDVAIDAWLIDSSDRLAAASEEIRWHPNAQDLRWRIGMVHAARDQSDAAIDMLDVALQAPLGEGTPPAAWLRARGLWLSVAAARGVDVAAELEPYAEHLRHATSRARETRAYGWAQLGRAANAMGDSALAGEAGTQLIELLDGATLPWEDDHESRSVATLLGRGVAVQER
jgi:eukaryotic-like serine/threonine-protein kinase